MTHSTIEAIHNIQRKANLVPENIDKVEVTVVTGAVDVWHSHTVERFEGKFSLRYCAAIAINGDDTARLDTYSDEMVKEPHLVDLLNKVTVAEKDSLERMAAEDNPYERRRGSLRTL